MRLWRRPKVKEGGRYPVGRAQIEVDGVELVPFASITTDNVRRSGEQDREALRRRAAHAGPVADDTLLYRVKFHLAESSSGPIRGRTPGPSLGGGGTRRASRRKDGWAEDIQRLDHGQ